MLDQGAVRFTVPEADAALAAREPHGSTPVAAPQSEPPAKLVLGAPLADRLARGVLFLPYRAENAQLVPVFGASALAVSPRVGHVHVTVDGAPWHWADASGNPIIINGLAPGPHKVLIQLVNADHQTIDQGTVEFTTPPAAAQHAH